MLDVQRLRLLAELHRLGTVSAVARAQFCSPSAVSQQLARLEREAGVPLLERAGRRVRLTDAALGLVAHADAVAERLERAESELREAAGEVGGLLRIASFQTPLLTIAPRALTALEAEHPALRLVFAQRELPEAIAGLRSHEFDLVLGEEFPCARDALVPGIDRAELIADDLLLVVPERGPWSRPAALSDLHHARWVLEPDDTAAGLWQRAELRRHGIEPAILVETPDPLLQAHFVRTGHAVALIPALVASTHLDGTRALRLPGMPRRSVYTAVRSGRAGHPGIRAVRRALHDAALLDAGLVEAEQVAAESAR